VRHLHFLVEGQTEEVVVQSTIEPYFSSLDIWISLSLLKTKRPAGGPAFKGGITNWQKISREVRLLLRDSSIDVLTTILDYYAFPPGAPGMTDRPQGSPYDRVRHVERALAKEIGDQRFLPHLVLHEIETWVLADCVRLGEVMGDAGGAAELSNMVKQESNPELVDDGPATTPSKRILNAYPNDRKTIDGPLVIADAGLTSIRQSCPHADEWLKNIEAKIEPQDRVSDGEQ
jgi:hypothetical protein